MKIDILFWKLCFKKIIDDIYDYWDYVDDVLKIAGHRMETAELESCMVSYHDVAESVSCGVHDEIKGEAIIAFVVLKSSRT